MLVRHLFKGRERGRILNTPNWNKWNLMPEVEIWQAAALSLNIDPDSIDMNDRWSYMQIKSAFEDMQRDYIDRLEIIAGHIGHTLSRTNKRGMNIWQANVMLTEFVSWCGRSNISIPSQLIPSQTLQKTIADKIAPANNAATYSTKWLEIQQAAIAQFFNPRRNPDAKKEAVIEWINAKAVEAKLGESNNIASTIFTIIKPENHDPKKKRVES